jgi:DNA-binding MarR family transcriptional regulator
VLIIFARKGGSFLPTLSYQLDLLNRQINQAHRGAVQAQLNKAGLREVGHPMLLAILQSSQPEDPDCRCHAQRELAEMLHISPAAVTNSLNSLEKGGYIRREPGRDARRNRVLLTEKGQDAVKICEQAFTTVSARMLAGFTPEELQQIVSFRERMLSNLRQGEDPEHPNAKEES